MTPSADLHLSHLARLKNLEATVRRLSRRLDLIEAKQAPELVFPAEMVAIAEATAIEHGLSLAQLRGPSRLGRFVPARHMAFRRLYLAGFSYPAIGRFFSRDHSTVRHGAMKCAAVGACKLARPME